MMYDHIIFFNQMRNGDVHVSRNFVKYLMSIIPAQLYTYAHNNCPKLVQDIPNLKYSNMSISLPEYLPYFKTGNTLYINTWIGQKRGRYCHPQGCTFIGNIRMYNDMLAELHRQSLPCGYEQFLPTINYEKFDIQNIKQFMAGKDNKKVLIANGNAMSGQVQNFDFDPIIDFLSNKYQEVLFFITNQTKIKKHNVIHCPDIIKTTRSDLNECSYIGTFCDIIVGRSSGPYTFSLTKDNLENPKKTFICFVCRRDEGIWYPEAKAKIIWSNNYLPNSIIDTISRELNG